MSDQFKGLTDAAKDFLAKHIPVCPHCDMPVSYPKRIGFFFDSGAGGQPLLRYRLRSGEYVSEFLQVARVSGDDTMFYLGLRTSGRTYWWNET